MFAEVNEKVLLKTVSQAERAKRPARLVYYEYPALNAGYSNFDSFFSLLSLSVKIEREPVLLPPSSPLIITYYRYAVKKRFDLLICPRQVIRWAVQN